MKKNLKFKFFATIFICSVFSLGLISQSMSMPKLPDLGMYGFLKLGKFKKLVKWGRTITLTPADATLISNGKPAFEVYYSHREYQGVAASGFKNKVYFNGNVVSIQSQLSLTPKEIKPIHTQAYLGPQDGRLEIHIDDENVIRESREDNNFNFFVNVKFRGFSQSDTGSQKLPDLIVRRIRLVDGCKIEVSVKNIGTAGVPDSYYNLPNAVGVQMYNGTKPWGGLILKGFDPAGKLKTPGGIATYIWFPGAANLNLTPGTHSIKVVVDSNSNLTELKENNNSLTRRLTCRQSGSQKLPDLIVRRIRLVEDCKIEVSVKNIGTAGVPDSYYNLPNAVGVQMYNGTKPWGGLILKGFDPAGKLKTPGGIATYIWFPGAANLKLAGGTHSIKVIVDSNSNLTELNETNNSLTRRLTCRRLTRVTTSAGIPVNTLVTAPQRFFVDFNNNAYLVYTPQYKSMQIAADKNVVSYGGDWEKCNMKPYLYHIRQKVWKGFYWKVDTIKKEAYRVTGGSFCKPGGTEQKLQMSVSTVGGSETVAPNRFFLRFPAAYLVYVPSSKTMQFVTESNVLNYGTDWQRCNLNTFTYHFKQKFMKNFFWAVNTQSKKALRVRRAVFCKPGGSTEPINASVRVVK